MDELKQQLLSIKENYINLVRGKTQYLDALSRLGKGAELADKYISSISDELIAAANDFIEKNNISDKSEIEEIIKEHISNFSQFCLIGR